MMITLTVLAGPDTGQVFTVSTIPFIIGRDSACAVVLHDSRVSRQHCRIEETEGVLQLTDLRTLNGTFLNCASARIVTAVLEDGADISLGGSRLRIEWRLPVGGSDARARSTPRATDTPTDEGPTLELAVPALTDSTALVLPANWQTGPTVRQSRSALAPLPAEQRTVANQPSLEQDSVGDLCMWLRRWVRLFTGAHAG